MRHASSHFTLQTYTQAQIRTKRAAQRRVVEELLAEDHQDSIPIPVTSRLSPYSPTFRWGESHYFCSRPDLGAPPNACSIR